MCAISHQLLTKGIIQKFILGSCSTKIWGHNRDQVLVEADGDLYSIHILESWRESSFVDVKWVKIPRLAALQVAKYL